ncbi:protein-tyrosine phosphatase family protein [Halodesulfovibrio marinisediminis]|uniref:Protein tyrosine phosphatase n=1 Tax=Halodesulfovibrio marinisediminis DSM 17456 TaxID=1121457 RepID=A0A1N6I8C5_9BACT|nr:protein-tyrosine phosphatase family protein [Halodesulfovibrio marinisediminis]SIO28278.1 Protein tyrosine phosphatase [Halodesulfovibrio marinisediminis DSM 17456]
MPVTNNGMSAFQAQVQSQVAQGRGDEVGRFSLGSKQEVKGKSDAQGGAVEKIFRRNNLSSKTEATQKAFADKVVSFLKDKFIPESALRSGHLVASTEGRLMAITDNKLTHNEALELLSAASDRPTLVKAPPVPPHGSRGNTVNPMQGRDLPAPPVPPHGTKNNTANPMQGRELPPPPVPPHGAPARPPKSDAVKMQGRELPAPPVPPHGAPARPPKSDAVKRMQAHAPELPPKSSAVRQMQHSVGMQSTSRFASTDATVTMLNGPALLNNEFRTAMTPMIVDRLGEQGNQIMAPGARSRFYDTSSAMTAECRYKDIKPPVETLVQTSKLINANHITLNGKEYGIATQAPMQETRRRDGSLITKDTQNEFWSMVDEKNVTTILDLTRDSDVQQRKIPQYRPDEPKNFSQVSVSPQSKFATQDGVHVDDFLVEGRNGDTQLRAIHYKGWPDHGAVTPKELHKIVGLVKDAQKGVDGTLAVHCTAGVGRTGTVYSALALNDMFASGELTPENANDKVLDVIADGRQSRGAAFVQTQEQAKLLLDYAHMLLGA